MLTADLVRAYRRGKELHISALKPADRKRAEALAERYLSIVKGHLGQSRGAVDEALAAVPFSARDRKLAGGLRKLIADRCQFEAATEHDPVSLRRIVFERAGRARRGSQDGETFDRTAILTDVAADLQLGEPAAEVETAEAETAEAATAEAATAEAAKSEAAEVVVEREQPAQLVERLMYTDLKHAHRLLSFTGLPPAVLVDLYQEGQAQAILLRARHVVVRVQSANPADIRSLFRKLKFLRLLHKIEATDEGYEITVDGPYSLFRSVTKYGLGLALMLPALRACERWSLDADVEWGKLRDLLHFHLTSSGDRHVGEPASLPDEVQALLTRFEQRRAAEKTQWEATAASDILALPGVGLCVPDLMFVHQETGECIYLEVMGFWSRDAVWRRVELLEAGLPHRIVFAVSSRLRVSEAALSDDVPGALYVYKGAMSVRAIEERLEALRG